MKKGLIIIVVLALFLCAVAGIGVGAFYYFYMKQTPEKAYKEALVKYEEGKYYQFESVAEIKLDLEMPDYPEYSSSTDIAVTNTGKVDIQNGKMYIRSDTDTDGTVQSSEYYNLEDTVYVKADGDEFSKYTEEEAQEQGVLGGDRNIEILTSLTGDEEYTLLADDSVDGVDCYHYEVTLDKTILDKMIDDFVLSMDKSANLKMDAEDMNITKATMELWVSKSSSTVLKSITTIEEMSYEGEEQGVGFTLSMKSINIDTKFSSWDEAVEIKAPV